MRRALLALAVAAGLALGTVVPVSALGDTSVTLNCSDGTSVQLLVDTSTLNALTDAVNAMTLYPAGLTCSLIQNPLGTALFGHVALAGAGQNPFVVGGGRWQVPCDFVTGVPIPGLEPPTVAFVGGGTVARVPGSWSYEPTVWPSTQATGTPIFVNIAVNFHLSDASNPSSAFGSLAETIPTQSTPDCGTINERHFTSTPKCLQTFSSGTGYPRPAAVTAYVTQQTGAAFLLADLNTNIHFSFTDNGQGPTPPDMLQGPPAADDSACPAQGTAPGFSLANGNISVRNPMAPPP